MDIVVEGVGKKYYTPDEVEISLQFYTRENSYEKALEEGTKDVEGFIHEVLESMNFQREDMKTRNFRIYEENRYDYDKKKYVYLGFAYTQQAIIKFDYNKNRIAEFMEKISRLKNAPKYTLQFNVKNVKQCKEEALAEAYQNAKEKAEAIAKAAGKEIKECVKTDFKPFDEKVISGSSLNSQDMPIGNLGTDNSMLREKRSAAVAETIQTIFTPEDIIISETLYCLWITY